jgi:hypothetical protein
MLWTKRSAVLPALSGARCPGRRDARLGRAGGSPELVVRSDVLQGTTAARRRGDAGWTEAAAPWRPPGASRLGGGSWSRCCARSLERSRIRDKAGRIPQRARGS